MRKAFRWLKRITMRFPDDRATAAMRGELGARDAAPASGPVVAMQCLEDPFYFGLFTAISRHLSETRGTSGDLVVVRSIHGAVGDTWRARMHRSTLLGMLIVGKWVRVHMESGARMAYRSASLTHPLGDLVDWFRARALWHREKSNPDITALRIHGLPVGDLIIDSYLRFRPAPRFDMSDPFVARIIWQVHRDVRRARAYFRARKPILYLTSYTTYVEHGVATRVALEQGVPVRSFGSLVQIGKRITTADWFHTPDASSYRSTFETLDRQQMRLGAAEKELSTRLSGGIDIATSYMRVSAYANPAEALPDVAGRVVVFLHDFYDSPHVYAELVFPDFWSWVSCTIETFQQAGIPFALKPHPNQISLSSEVIQALRARYPGILLLSAGATNSRLAAAGIRCGVTVYGTVAHELGFLGVPSIACARHPHHSFEFCRTAHSVEEYRELLQTAGQTSLTLDEMRRQALAFYYMHNLHGEAESLVLRQKFIGLWKACGDADASAAQIATAFNDMRNSTAFRAAVERMAAPVMAPRSGLSTEENQGVWN